MAKRLTSRVGKINTQDETVYRFISNFNNFTHLVPHDQIQDWQADENSCSFSIAGIGQTGMKIIEKEPFALIKISADETSKFGFLLWIQLKKVDEMDTRVKITMEPQLNAMMWAMAKKTLQKFVDTLVDRLEQINFSAY